MIDPRPTSEANWERSVIEKLASAAIVEQRRSRRWSIFFRTLLFIYLFVLLFIWMGWFGSKETNGSGKHTALIELRGPISAEGPSSADRITTGLKEAFEDENTQGVVLRINSPGGSPVQAGYIYDEIRRLRARYPNVPLYVVVEDICASGGYYVAAAADRIYVDKASLVGSIGVLMDGFGFTGTLEKLGIERRLITAGENKGFMDPFSPVNPQQKAYAEQMIAEIHQQFVNVVRQGRSKRLRETPEMFTGLIWTGQRSIELGLTDGFGSVDYVAREVIKAENIVDYTPRENIAERFAKRLGAGMTQAILPAFEQLGTRLR